MSIDIVKRTKAVYQENGLLRLLKQSIPFLYKRTIRSYLPYSKTPRMFSGVQVPGGKILDPYVPFFNAGQEHYETEIIEGLSERVNADDTVVIVGGGWGVSAVKAAELVGENGSVIVYEAAEKQVEFIQDTLQMNDFSEIVVVQHGLLGDAINVYSDLGGAPNILAESLPECDHLVLDCEGAETYILAEMKIRPRNLIVETHAQYGAPKDDVEGILVSIGYDVIDEIPKWEARGIHILIASTA